VKNIITEIVSGGQTGADRAALDWALAHNLPCGGWCPKGRKAEDGTISSKYPLKACPSDAYLQRTEWNVRDSDATIVFSVAPVLVGGSEKTVEFAKKYDRPCLHLHPGEKNAVEKLHAFIAEHQVRTLNVAGSRASEEPGVGRFVTETLDRFLELSKH
jgi:hypothetical protein